MNDITVGYALCGSFCTFDKAITSMQVLIRKGYKILPIMSFNASNTDTRFGTAADFKNRIECLCKHEILDTLVAVEPVGPKKLCDILLVAPCTGNTLSKLCIGISDTPVTLAVKSHLRNRRPVVIGLSSNDALSACARNVGDLLNRRNYYFVPFSQDDAENKPTSAVADFELIPKTLDLALKGFQIQPIIK